MGMIINPYRFASVYQNDSAVSFDGVNQSLSVPAIAALQSASTFTMLFWQKLDIPNISGTDVVFSWFTSTASRIEVQVTSTQYLILFGNNFGEFTPPSDNLYHKIRIVYNGGGATNADRLKVYVDEVLQTLSFTGTIPATTAASYANRNIGSRTTVIWLEGILDEFAIYTSASTTAGGTGACPVDLTTAAGWAQNAHWWKMGDGDTYPTIIDHGNVGGANLTMNNMSAANFVVDTPC